MYWRFGPIASRRFTTTSYESRLGRRLRHPPETRTLISTRTDADGTASGGEVCRVVGGGYIVPALGLPEIFGGMAPGPPTQVYGKGGGSRSAGMHTRTCIVLASRPRTFSFYRGRNATRGREGSVRIFTHGRESQGQKEKRRVSKRGSYTSPDNRHSTVGLPLEISCPQGCRCGYT